MRQIGLQKQMQTAGYDASREFRELAAQIIADLRGRDPNNLSKYQQLSILVQSIDSRESQIGAKGFEESYNKFIEGASGILDVKEKELKKGYSEQYEKIHDEIKQKEKGRNEEKPAEVKKAEKKILYSKVSDDGSREIDRW